MAVATEHEIYADSIEITHVCVFHCLTWLPPKRIIISAGVHQYWANARSLLLLLPI